MLKKIFLLLIIFLLNFSAVEAKHNWVYTGDGIEIFVEDTTIEISDDRKEFSVTVIDKIIGQKNFHISRFNFYRQDENWFYNITGKGTVIPVSKTNASGYILEFVEKIFPEESVEENFSDDEDFED